MDTKEKIAVMSAYTQGQGVHSMCLDPETGWRDDPFPDWNWKVYDYRIAVKPIECWVVVAATGDIVSQHSTAAYAASMVVELDGIAGMRGPYRAVLMREVV